MNIAHLFQKNNRAAQFYREGETDRDYLEIRETLCLLREMCIEAENGIASFSLSSSLIGTPNCEFLPEHTIVNQTSCSNFAGISFCQDDYMFKGAFVLGDDIPLQTNAASAVVLYNLAQLTHQIGIKTGKSESMKKSLSIYAMSLRLLETSASLLEESDTLVFLLAALHVNIGQLLKVYFQVEKAKQFLSKFEEIVLWIEEWEYISIPIEIVELLRRIVIFNRSENCISAPCA